MAVILILSYGFTVKTVEAVPPGEATFAVAVKLPGVLQVTCGLKPLMSPDSMQIAEPASVHCTELPWHCAGTSLLSEARGVTSSTSPTPTRVDVLPPAPLNPTVTLATCGQPADGAGLGVGEDVGFPMMIVMSLSSFGVVTLSQERLRTAISNANLRMFSSLTAILVTASASGDPADVPANRDRRAVTLLRLSTRWTDRFLGTSSVRSVKHPLSRR